MALKIFLALSLLAAVLLGGWLWKGKKAAGREGFVSAPAAVGDLVITISASGTVEPVQSLYLSFKNPGTIKVVAVEQGQEVEEGQLLLAQDDAEQQAELASAQANLRSAMAQLAKLQNGNLPEEIAQLRWEEESARVTAEAAAKQLNRVKELWAAGAATQKELDEAQSSYAASLAKWQQAQSKLKLAEAGPRAEEIEQARAAVEAAAAKVRQAELNLEATQLRAPFDGIVAEVNATAGQRVTGVTVSGADNTSRPLLSVVSKKLRVRAQVNEADIGQVVIGQKATFVVNAFPERKFNAWVSAVSPQAITVSNVQFYEVLLEIEGDTSGLKAGMPCNVEIIKESREKVLTIPKQALTFARSYAAKQGGGQGVSSPGRVMVLVMNKERVEWRPVQVGLSNNQLVEVLEGLKEGEQVVIGQREGMQKASAQGVNMPFLGAPPPPPASQGGGAGR